MNTIISSNIQIMTILYNSLYCILIRHILAKITKVIVITIVID